MSIELLAPAKDKKCAIAAIDCGADAVYIGASEFGARKNAQNSLDDIKEVVEYAHKFNVRVYITLNTILTDDEVEKAKNLITELKEIGVDAIIIQDMGLFEFIKKLGMEIHASTQCDNRTVEKVKFLENVGFSRVVLARELSLEQIKEVKKQTNVELEAFIHGALCVSYSGQCYMSQLIGRRSANRGECAQPCRKKYSLVDEEGNFIAKDKYLLCLKDFNASRHIKELADAGVTSFKIEGRLKDENYVRNVIAYYRKLIDDLGLKKTSSGKVLLDFEPNLEKSFNRGFTDYFLEGRKDCFNFDSPKSKGEYIGKVSKVGRDYFEVNAQLSPQDGLCFMDKGELSGCLVNKVEKNKVYPNKMDGIKVGTEIYRNFDSEFEKKLKNSKTCRKIGVNVEFGLDKIKAIDEDGHSAEIGYSFDEFAQNTQKMGENIINQFKKSGETEFLVEDVKILTDKIPFLPVSKLNELRRDFLDKLINERKNTPHPNFYDSQARLEFLPLSRINRHPPFYGSPTRLEDDLPQGARVTTKLDYRANILNKSAKTFYENCGCEIVEPAVESGNVQKIGKTSMTCKHCLKYAFNLCKKNNARRALRIPKRLSKRLFLIDEKNKHYELKFDCNKCEMEIIF